MEKKSNRGKKSKNHSRSPEDFNGMAAMLLSDRRAGIFSKFRQMLADYIRWQREEGIGISMI